MWHDNETTTDYLNFGVVANACAKLLQHRAVRYRVLISSGIPRDRKVQALTGPHAGRSLQTACLA